MKNNKFAFLGLVLILALTTLACSFNGINISVNTETVKGSGQVKTEVREVNNISRVSLSSIGDLTIVYADQEKLEISAEENLLSYITSEVQSGKLTLGTENNINLMPTETIEYTLYVTEPIEELSVSGLGNIKAPELTMDNLSLNVSGAGDVKVDSVTADQLEVRISGLGSIFVNAGQVVQQNINISGSGTFQAGDLRSQKADVRISGLGNAEVWAEDELDAKISGSGDISYYGSPSIRQDISGLGNLRSNGEH
ncbi:MAG: hypothetical protein CL609_03935 [Anaerolineaceae bacterium]|nr:hypothetical protein [Anaerolineaceae bacterium]